MIFACRQRKKCNYLYLFICFGHNNFVVKKLHKWLIIACSVIIAVLNIEFKNVYKKNQTPLSCSDFSKPLIYQVNKNAFISTSFVAKFFLISMLKLQIGESIFKQQLHIEKKFAPYFEILS